MSKFDAEEALRLIAENWHLLDLHGADHDVAHLAPAAGDTCALRRFPRSKAVWHGAAPMPMWLKEAWIEWLGPERIWEMYGGTEGQGLSTINGTEWLAHKVRSGRSHRPPNSGAGRERKPVPVANRRDLHAPRSGPGSTYHYLGAPRRASWRSFEFESATVGWVDADGLLLSRRPAHRQ
jgi:bile acid-coenzyme A ligase